MRVVVGKRSVMPPGRCRRGIRWRRSTAVISGSLYRAVNRGPTSGVRRGGGPPRRTGMPWSCRVRSTVLTVLSRCAAICGELHRRSGPAPAAAPVQPLPVHDLPPTQTLRGRPHRMRHHPGRAAASGAAGLRARTHTSSTVSTMSIVATGVPWSRVAEVSGALRRLPPGRHTDPPQPPRSDGPVQHHRGTAGIRPGTPRLGGSCPDRR